MDRLADLMSPQDFSNLLSGEPNIDVDDWEKNTKYAGGFTKESPQIEWFWKIVRKYDQKDREKLLHFATGSRRPPVGGFAYLMGFAGGLHKFTVHGVKSEKDMNRLPTAHACICTIDMPAYPSLECLEERLRVVLIHGSKGFDQEEEDDDGDDDGGDDDGKEEEEDMGPHTPPRIMPHEEQFGFNSSDDEEEKVWEALD
jgi:hypothetical protein